MKRVEILIFIFFILLHSCDNKKPLLTENIKYLNLDVKDEKEFNYSMLFDTCIVVPLETKDDALIGGIGKIIATERSLIILDSKMSKSVFIYDYLGNLKNIIHHEGEGPGEYLYPFNIFLTESKNELILFDSRNSKAVFYDLEGEFIKEVKLGVDGRYTDLMATNEELYIAGGDYSNRFKSIRVVDNDFNIKSKINVYSPEDLWLIEGDKRNYFFEKSDGNGFYYKGWLNNKILEVVDGQVTGEINISLSEGAFSFEAGKPITLNELNTRIKNEEAYLVGDNIIDGENFLLITIQKGLTTRLALWDKTTDKIQCIRYLINDMDGTAFPKMPGGMFGFNSNSDLYITMMYPSYFNEAKEKGIPESPYKERLEKIQVDNVDNPILFIYKFKEYFDE